MQSSVWSARTGCGRGAAGRLRKAMHAVAAAVAAAAPGYHSALAAPKVAVVVAPNPAAAAAAAPPTAFGTAAVLHPRADLACGCVSAAVLHGVDCKDHTG